MLSAIKSGKSDTRLGVHSPCEKWEAVVYIMDARNVGQQIFSQFSLQIHRPVR